MLDVKAQPYLFKNNRLNHLGIQEMLSKKTIKPATGNHPLLQKDHAFFYPKHSGITEVTARSELHTSLFALNFCIKCLNKEKKSFYAVKSKMNKLAKIFKTQENIGEMKRNFYKGSPIQK